jgi:SAM-dependent methyltransferase
MSSSTLPPWRTVPRLALMRSAVSRRLWARTRGRSSELAFWQAWLVGAPGTEEWAGDRELRFAASTELRDPVLRAEVERLPQESLSILDVGSGPVTNAGFCHPRKRISLVPVDPLADEYDRMLRAAGLEPPVRTHRVAGERLLDHFGAGRFDIAYACNSLDHSADPLRIVENMVAVVRPGGVVLLRHAHREGEERRYEGLHQWNFDVVDGDLVIWNSAVTIDVQSALGDRASVETWLEESAQQQGQVLARLAIATLSATQRESRSTET